MNDVVYKFRDFTNPLHRDILYHNEIFFAPIDSFNDPFDCGIIPDYERLKNREQWEIFVNNINLSEQDVVKLNDKYDKDPEEVINNYKTLYLHQQRDTTGIFSCSKIWDSVLMWSHYSNNHKGFAVGLDSNLMWVKLGDYISAANSVHYPEDDKMPSLNPSANDFKTTISNKMIELFYKSKFWCYEEEFRFISISKEKIKDHDRVVKIPDEVFAEVILGLNFPHSQQSKLEDICKSKNIPLYRCKKIDGTFKLKRVPVFTP